MENLEEFNLKFGDDSSNFILNFYKNNKTVFVYFRSNNFTFNNSNFQNKIPKDFSPVSPILFPVGNGGRNEVSLLFGTRGEISIYANNITINHLPSRTISYFSN